MTAWMLVTYNASRVRGQARHDVGRLAQWLERLLHTQEVTGSSPVPPTIKLEGLGQSSCLLSKKGVVEYKLDHIIV